MGPLGRAGLDLWRRLGSLIGKPRLLLGGAYSAPTRSGDGWLGADIAPVESKPPTRAVKSDLRRLVEALARLEFDSDAGRLNLGFMLLSVILVAMTTVSPVLEALVRLVKPEFNVGVSWLQLFICWAVLMLMCIGMVGCLESGRRRPPE